MPKISSLGASLGNFRLVEVTHRLLHLFKLIFLLEKNGEGSRYKAFWIFGPPLGLLASGQDLKSGTFFYTS
jgi:hypothetical protein